MPASRTKPRASAGGEPPRPRANPCFGSHVSVAGGLAKGVQRALECGCDCLQIFTKNNNQWKAKPLEDQVIEDWHTAYQASKLQHAIAHASYLINLASPDKALWQKSVNALVVEWNRAEQLRLEGLVVHPGAFTTSDEASGMQRIVDAIDAVLQQVEADRCRLLLENTAGQGSCLGCNFSQLGWLIEQIDAPEHVAVCFDTCHAFAAGYELNTPDGFAAMKQELTDQLPAGVIEALHLNDSKKGCGSRVDRHEHIGRGEIGCEGFALLFADADFRRIPGYLETAKGNDDESGELWDVLNLRMLREIAAG